MSLQLMSAQGVIARSIADVRLGFGPLCRKSPHDPLWRGEANSGKVRDAGPLVVGYCVDPTGEGVHREVEKAVIAGAQAARAAGYEVREIKLPMVHEAARAWGELLNVEIENSMAEVVDEHGSDDVKKVLFAYADTLGVPDLAGFVAAQSRRLDCQRAWALMFQDVDAVIMPVSSQLPFRTEQDFAEPDTLVDILMAQRSLFIINLLGLPSAVVRTTDLKPIPLGVQVVGAMSDDDICLDVAGAIETELGFDLAPIGLH